MDLTRHGIVAILMEQDNDKPTKGNSMELKLKGQTGWGAVESALCDARGIAFDGCHKIYILMDEDQMDKMRGYGYDPLISASDMNEYDMFELVQEWYEESCGLRFVHAVHTVDGDPNEGFLNLIPQGFDDE
jgi:hypothetical protein